MTEVVTFQHSGFIGVLTRTLTWHLRNVYMERC